MPTNIPIRNPGLSVTTTNLLLPQGFPAMPASVKQRFPEMAEWEANVLRWYRSLFQALIESNRQTSTSVSQNYAEIQDAFTQLGAFTSTDDNGLKITAVTFDGQEYQIDGTKVVGVQGAAVADSTGAGDVVAQLNTLLARIRAHGLIAP